MASLTFAVQRAAFDARWFQGSNSDAGSPNGARLPSSALLPTSCPGIEVQNYEEASLSKDAVPSPWTLEGSRHVGRCLRV